jgi:hypothetical protein
MWIIPGYFDAVRAEDVIISHDGHVLAHLGPTGEVDPNTMGTVAVPIPRLAFYDDQNRIRMKLALTTDGTPTLELFDVDGRAMWRAPERTERNGGRAAP